MPLDVRLSEQANGRAALVGAGAAVGGRRRAVGAGARSPRLLDPARLPLRAPTSSTVAFIISLA